MVTVKSAHSPFKVYFLSVPGIHEKNYIKPLLSYLWQWIKTHFKSSIIQDVKLLEIQMLLIHTTESSTAIKMSNVLRYHGWSNGDKLITCSEEV